MSYEGPNWDKIKAAYRPAAPDDFNIKNEKARFLDFKTPDEVIEIGVGALNDLEASVHVLRELGVGEDAYSLVVTIISSTIKAFRSDIYKEAIHEVARNGWNKGQGTS